MLLYAQSFSILNKGRVGHTLPHAKQFPWFALLRQNVFLPCSSCCYVYERLYMNGASSRSAMRALEVLEAFRTARRPLSLSELARLADMPVSTCHGVFKAMEERGFLYFVSGRDAYPTRRLWDLAEEINAHDPVAMSLQPALAQLRDEVDETVILGVRHADSVLYLLVLESSKAIRYSSRVGDYKPLHSSSIGKVMLGALSPTDLDIWLEATRLERITDRTVVSGTRLKADITASRVRGYYVTKGENVSDVMAVAAPLRLGKTTFGVAIAGPLHRLAEKEGALSKRLLRCLRTIESNTQREPLAT